MLLQIVILLLLVFLLIQLLGALKSTMIPAAGQYHDTSHPLNNYHCDGIQGTDPTFPHYQWDHPLFIEPNSKMHHSQHPRWAPTIESANIMFERPKINLDTYYVSDLEYDELHRSCVRTLE